MSEFKIRMEFGFYDVVMLAQMIAHARRYGDNQVSDWAGELRDRMNAAANGGLPSKPTLLELQPVMEKDATAVLETISEKPAEDPAKAINKVAKATVPKAK